MSTGEFRGNDDPLAAEFSPVFDIPMAELQLDHIDQTGRARIFERPAMTLEAAARIYERDGVVIIDPSCRVELTDHLGDLVEAPLGEYAEIVRGHTVSVIQEIWAMSPVEGPDGEEVLPRDQIIPKKKYKAYNATNRNMRTVSYPNVSEHLPGVIKHQTSLLPTVRRVTGDRTVEVSTDPDEGTVINLQVFQPSDSPQTRQEHGAHTDRVDTTTIICLENVGEHGAFVYPQGYNAACKALGLEVHEAFGDNVAAILDSDQRDSVEFHIYPLKRGSLLMAKSAEDVHFITAKTKADADAGWAAGHGAIVFADGTLLARGVINAAYETQTCRDNFATGLAAVERHPYLGSLEGKELTVAARQAAAEDIAAGLLQESDVEHVVTTLVTQSSARDLYTRQKEESTEQ